MDRLGHFVLERRIGRGGAAQVHLARDVRSGQTVALKVLAVEHRDEGPARKAFRREAKVALTLSHPNLVSCLDAGVDQDPPWIAYELVKGTALPALLKRSGFLDPAWATNIVLDVALGLAALHQKGVVHRDVKPANVLFSNDGHIKLIDFGAALSADGEHAGPEEDDLGWSGTLSYASPEQLQGRDLDGRSDLYSLGLVFYEMLTGHRPVTARDRMAALAAHGRLLDELDAPSALRPDVPASLDAIVFGLLDPFAEERRFSDALALVDALEALAVKQGWVGREQLETRRRARGEIVETAYWQLRNHLGEGDLDGNLDRAERVVELLRENPDRTVAESVARDLLELLGEAEEPELFASMDDGTRLALLERLRRFAALGRNLDHRLLRVVVARRAMTVAEGLDGGRERLRALERHLMVDPGHVTMGLRAVELAEAMGRRSFAANMRAAMAVLGLERGWIAKAVELAGASKSSPVAPGVLAKARARQEARATFRRVFDLLRGRGCTAEALNLSRRFLQEEGGWARIWAARSEIHADRGELVEAGEAAREAGTLALERGRLAEARRHFGRCLDWNGRDEQAWAGYHESSLALGCVPGGWTDGRSRRMALLLADGHERAVESDVEGLFADGLDAETLHRLLALLPGGISGLRARLERERAIRCLEARDAQGALLCFELAITASPNPEGELEAILALPGVRGGLSLFERMRLRRVAGRGDAATSPGRAAVASPAGDGSAGIAPSDLEAMGLLRQAT